MVQIHVRPPVNAVEREIIMAIRMVQSKSLKQLEHVARADDALAEGTDYDAYLKSGDINKLTFKPGMVPTKFIINLEHSGRDSAFIKNNMVSGTDEDGKPKMSVGSWQYALARRSITAIINPPDLPLEECIVFKKDETGQVDDSVMGKLEKHGIVSEIFGLYSALVLNTSKGESKNS